MENVNYIRSKAERTKKKNQSHNSPKSVGGHHGTGSFSLWDCVTLHDHDSCEIRRLAHEIVEREKENMEGQVGQQWGSLESYADAAAVIIIIPTETCHLIWTRWEATPNKQPSTVLNEKKEEKKTN